MKCPRCDGTGKLFPGIPPDSVWDDRSCVRCLGDGNVPREMLKWMERGDKLKQRIRQLKMYELEVEKATKIPSSTLYKILDGLIVYPINPNPLDLVNKWIKEQKELKLWPPRDWHTRV